MVYRIGVKGEHPIGASRIHANIAYAHAHVPEVAYGVPREHPVAVCGGGPSLRHALDDLRAWKGDIWAINGTWKWLCDHGVTSTFFSVDPGEDQLSLIDGRVNRALLAAMTDTRVFEALEGKAVMFDTEHGPDPVKHLVYGGSTSAGRAPRLAIMMGYAQVHFFGCDSSFSDSSHVFKNESPEEQVLIQAGDAKYRTSLQFMDQAQFLAEFMVEFPTVFVNRSGGLIKAMVENWKTWEVVGMTKALKEILDPEENPEKVEY